MNVDVKAEAYHTQAYASAGVPLMDFTPINQIHQHLCGIHTYAQDPSRRVSSHHFCTHASKDMHQCVIYDSAEANARLIGIEYIISSDRFEALPSEEKKYWHSHQHEVESGQLHLVGKSLVPQAALLQAEQPAMINLRTTYGKTFHTWQFDIHPDLPLGPPSLMMSLLDDSKLTPEEKDAASERKAAREKYLPLDDGFKPSQEADAVNNKGKPLEVQVVEK